MEKFRQQKLTRFEMDQQKIECLEEEINKIKAQLQKALQKKEDLYRISIEYQKLCEEEINKSQLLIKEIDRLNSELHQHKKEPTKQTKLNLYVPDFSVFQEEKLIKAFEVCADKAEKLKSRGFDFRSQIMPREINAVELEKVVFKLLKVIEDWIPHIGTSVHKKFASYDEKANNPVFKKTPHIVIKRPPRFDKEESGVQDSKIMSKDIIKDCFETFESGCVSTRSNFSANTMKKKVRVYRREKSVSQLV